MAAKLTAAAARAHRRHRRRSCGRRGDVRAQGSADPARASKSLDCRQDGAKLDPALGRASYLFNTTIAGIEQADAILLIGTNPRLEAAVLNARIRKRWRQGGLKVGVIGEPAELTYPYEYLGAGPQTLGEVADGKHSFAETLKGAKRPMVIVGAGAAARADGAAVLGLAARIALGAMRGQGRAGWNAFNVLHTAASRVAGLDLGFVPGKGGLDVAGQLAAAAKGNLDVLYLLGADEIELPLARQRLRHLPGQPRRSRRAARRSSSCRAPPTPRRAPPTSIPRAARR